MRRRFVYDKKTKKIVQVEGPPRTVSPSGNPIPMVNRAYSKKPVDSLALRVAPHQVEDMRQRVRESGAVGVEVRPSGRVLLHSQQGRKTLSRFLGYHDQDGGYGDP